jgi:hypothetical protein
LLSRQEEMLERQRTFENDLKLREQQGRVFAQDQSLPRQATTMHAFAEADANTPRGLFSAVEAATVIGSKSGVASVYPAASAAHQIQLPNEPPTGYRIDELEPSSCEAQAPGPTSDAPTPLGSTEVGPSFSENMVAQRSMSQMSSSSAHGDDVRSVERPPSQLKRRRL